MNSTLRLLQDEQTHDNGLIFGYFQPSHLDDSLLPSLRQVEGKRRLKVLVTHQYSYFLNLSGFVTDLDPVFIWNLAASIQFYHAAYDEEDEEGLDGLQIVYLLCRFHDCIPFHHLPVSFDCTLDLFHNSEYGLLDSDRKLVGCRRWKDEFLSDELKKEIERISSINIFDDAGEPELDHEKILL
jgi:hypothetical protein